MAITSLSSPYDDAQVLEYDDGSYSVEPIIKWDFIMNSTYTVKEGDTLQGISHAIYGDSGLWYILALANDIQNPFNTEEFYPGQLLNIP